jgi:circadian clock protein KaiC
LPPDKTSRGHHAEAKSPNNRVPHFARDRMLPKAATGIQGLDEITGGGLPKGRTTLLCGGAGCGKTLLAMEFLVRGAVEFGEPGVFMTFEENTDELAQNFAPLGFDLKALVAKKKLELDFVQVERSEIEETGEYDLDGLFIRLAYAIESNGAKRVVLDTIEALFAGLANEAILRAELRRLFRWLKEKRVTAIITGERGDGHLTRYGLEEYVADCVILLDHRVDRNMATRFVRIVKYRGSVHGTSEYPFLIDKAGISVLPITSLGLKHTVSTERVSSGVARLDGMMGGSGYYRGSSVLVSGSAGSGKTSLAAHFASAAVARGERCLWFAFEESSSQIIRNMRSIGIDLERAVEQGRLRFHAERPTIFGLEMHLASICRWVNEFKPRVVIIDPVTGFTALGRPTEINAMLTRMVDFFKMQQITALFTSLTSVGDLQESDEAGVSSLMDTWLLLRDIESGAERNRGLFLLKSRGMAHSNQLREFVMLDNGVELLDVYVGPSGALLTGSARAAQEEQEEAQAVGREQKTEGRKGLLERKRQLMETQIAALRIEYEAEKSAVLEAIEQDDARTHVLADERGRMARMRQADPSATVATRKHNGRRPS